MPGLNPLNRQQSLTGRLPFFLLILVLLGAVGCTSVHITNLSELTVRVLITLPDSAGGVSREIRSGQATETFSTFGGTVTIQTLPDEAYRELLVSVRDQLILRLFEEADTLTGEEAATLVNRLGQLDDALEQLSREGASCTVSAPDFSSVTALVFWDTGTNNWALNCGVSTFEE